MKKLVFCVLIFVSAVYGFARPAVEEGEDVRIYTPIELFEKSVTGDKGKSLGMPEMMEGGIKAKVLIVGKTEEFDGEKGNWCFLRLRLGMWNEASEWIPKGYECWGFIPEDVKIFRR